MTVVISNGIMIAVPTACTTRPAISSSMPGDTAQSSVPSVKIDMASRKIGRVLRRCSRKPVTGMTTAMVKRNAVVSHWATLAATPRSAIRCGMATLMMVSLRNTTKVETSSRAMTSLLRAASLWLTGGVPISSASNVVASVLMMFPQILEFALSPGRRAASSDFDATLERVCDKLCQQHLS
jgi:hypothetical protein